MEKAVAETRSIQVPVTIFMTRCIEVIELLVKTGHTQRVPVCVNLGVDTIFRSL